MEVKSRGKVCETVCEKACEKLLQENLPLPAYEMAIKASHAFNLLDARHAISVTERQRYILSVRQLTRQVADPYYQSRESSGFPLCKGLNNADK